MRDKATSQCPQTTNILKKKESEAESNRGPSAYQPNALPLGPTGSQAACEEQDVERIIMGFRERVDTIWAWAERNGN